MSTLDPDQAAALRPELPGGGPITLGATDQVLLAALAVDGRAGHPDLARRTGWSESTVRRRVAQLRASGVLRIQLDVAPRALGYGAEARLWMAIRPVRLAAVGNALAGHREVMFAAATTGTTNLLAAVACRDQNGLYQYLTGRIATLPGVVTLETAPVLRTVKRTGAALPVGAATR